MVHGQGSPGYERSDAAAGPVMRFGLALVLLVSLALLAMGWLFDRLEERTVAPAPSVFDAPPQAAPGPRLQVQPTLELKELREMEETLLGSYGWADREGEVARIPIDRAIRLLAERGLPLPEPVARGEEP